MKKGGSFLSVCGMGKVAICTDKYEITVQEDERAHGLCRTSLSPTFVEAQSKQSHASAPCLGGWHW